MFRIRRPYFLLSFVALLLAGGVIALKSQTPGRALIRQRIQENRLVSLAGNTPADAIAANDLGEVADGFSLDHMLLQLKRSPAQERVVEQMIADLHNPQSRNFHKWLSAADFGRQYGVADSDIQTVEGWLRAHGFTVNFVYPSGMVIDFSGNAGQVRAAFHTSVHNLNVNGVRHIANFSDPQIPEALAPVVSGILSLHDFRPHRMLRPKASKSLPQYTYITNGTTVEAVVPADLATIYDFNPAFTQGITGSGQTIAILEDTDLYAASDWTTFRTAFGLDQYSQGSLTTVYPQSAAGGNCAAPGVNADDSEAILDVEWASAAAPSATILMVACANTNVTSGLQIGGLNIVNSSTPPQIMSISYGGCEAESGATFNAAINALYQQAVAEGISVFVAAGDEGAASCDAGAGSATHGIGVSSQASTPYNVAVGGTDYADVVNGTDGMYWNKTNTSVWGSAQSYIPEMPWDESCANSTVATYAGYTTGYGASGFCNSSLARQIGLYLVVAGSGGPSGCATGAPSTQGVVGGTCQGYAKPSWQAGLPGIPNDGVRDIPDVSMFAAAGLWGHYSVVCFTDPLNGGTPCTGKPELWAGFGGTSIAAPVMAGIQALVNQHAKGAQGNPNPVYYTLAQKVPTAFHSVVQGDIVVNCNGTVDCFGYLGTLDYGRGGRVFGTTWGGALSASTTSYSPAYMAGAGWNFATGIGSVDVNNLVTNWSQGQ